MYRTKDWDDLSPKSQHLYETQYGHNRDTYNLLPFKQVRQPQRRIRTREPRTEPFRRTTDTYPARA